MKIAVLDDNITIAEMLQQGLELAGHTVTVYANPSAFFADTYRETPFDLLIVDLLLTEGISEGEVIYQVRDGFSTLPVILISAASSWQIEALKRAMPMVRVLREPFKIATLLTMINELAA